MNVSFTSGRVDSARGAALDLPGPTMEAGKAAKLLGLGAFVLTQRDGKDGFRFNYKNGSIVVRNGHVESYVFGRAGAGVSMSPSIANLAMAKGFGAYQRFESAPSGIVRFTFEKGTITAVDNWQQARLHGRTPVGPRFTILHSNRC